MRSRHNARRKSSQGQALIEALVSIAVMSTTCAVAVLLGKIILVKLAGNGASHSVAFECAILPRRCAKPRAQPTPETRQRIATDHFSMSRDGLVQIAAWTDRSGKKLIEQETDVSTGLSHPHFGAGLGTASNGAGSTIGSAARLISDLAGPGRFGLGITDGLITANVDVHVMRSASGSTDLLSRMRLPLKARSAILADHWNSSGPYGRESTSVQTRVDRGKQLNNALETGFKLAYAPTRASMLFMYALLLEADARKFKYHEIDMDIIPTDRVGR